MSSAGAASTRPRTIRTSGTISGARGGASTRSFPLSMQKGCRRGVSPKARPFTPPPARRGTRSMSSCGARPDSMSPKSGAGPGHAGAIARRAPAESQAGHPAASRRRGPARVRPDGISPDRRDLRGKTFRRWRGLDVCRPGRSSGSSRPSASRSSRPGAVTPSSSARSREVRRRAGQSPPSGARSRNGPGDLPSGPPLHPRTGSPSPLLRDRLTVPGPGGLTPAPDADDHRADRGEDGLRPVEMDVVAGPLDEDLLASGDQAASFFCMAIATSVSLA